MIDRKINSSDVFFRDLVVTTIATLKDVLKFENRFSNSEVEEVVIPVYYALTGKNQDYLLDSFSDDVLGDSRKVDMNTDIIPRAHLTLSSWRIKSDEFANPNVWLRQVKEDTEEIRKVLTKVRAIPITANFKAEILLASELDIFKASEAIMNALMFYKHMYFEHNFMYIDAIATFPDDHEISILRESNLEDDDTTKLAFDFEVQTYFPAWGEEQVWGRPRESKFVNYTKQASRNNTPQ